MTPRAIESRAQQRAQPRPIIGPPPAPVVTDRREAWQKRHAWHQATGQHYPLRLWRA